MPTRRMFLRTVLWLPPTLLLATACSGARPGVSVKLDADPPPPLGGTMTFRLTATCAWDAPNPNSSGVKTTDAEVSFVMTSGIVPVQLDPVWQFTPGSEDLIGYVRKVVFQANVPLVFTFPVKLEQEGEQRIGGGGKVGLQGSADSQSQVLYLQISSLGTVMQRSPFTPTR